MTQHTGKNQSTMNKPHFPFIAVEIMRVPKSTLHTKSPRSTHIGNARLSLAAGRAS